MDDESLARYGRWPWPRALVARLLEGVAAQEPSSIGIDAIFAEAELPLSGEGTPKRLSAGDAALAEALANGPFVLGYVLTFGREPVSANDTQPLHPIGLLSVRRWGDTDPRGRLWQATGAVSSLQEFTRSVAVSGFLNASLEQDGILRRMPVLIEKNGNVFPSLALATILRSLPTSEAILEPTWSGDLTLKIGPRSITLDDRGRLLLRYRGGEGTIKPISAASVMEGRIRADELKGRTVFIGATATGMGEAVATPMTTLLSGVQVHAIAAENILKGDVASVSPWAYQVLAIVSLGVGSTLLCAGPSIMAGACICAVASVAAWQGCAWLFQVKGFFLSPVAPLFSMALNFCTLTFIRSFFVEKRAQRQTQDLAATRDFIMMSLASLAEIRDIETGAHLLRTQRYLLLLCRELSRHPRFQALRDPDTIELVAKLAPLHDIGKVGLPDSLLRKTSGFTPEEYEEVKKHTIYGRDAIAKAEARVGAFNDQLIRYAKEIAYYHHERWDGSGYPEGLRGEQIPWVGRVLAVADAYDAIVSRRVYKKPIPHEEAVRLIVKGKGTLFDPDVVDAFLRIEAHWREVAAGLADSVRVEMETVCFKLPESTVSHIT